MVLRMPAAQLWQAFPGLLNCTEGTLSLCSENTNDSGIKGTEAVLSRWGSRLPTELEEKVSHRAVRGTTQSIDTMASTSESQRGERRLPQPPTCRKHHSIHPTGHVDHSPVGKSTASGSPLEPYGSAGYSGGGLSEPSFCLYTSG